jgi:hypothetical protein
MHLLPPAGGSLGAHASCAFVASRDSRHEPPTSQDLAYVPMTQGYDGGESGGLGPASTASRGGDEGDSYSPGAAPQPAFPSPFAVRAHPAGAAHALFAAVHPHRALWRLLVDGEVKIPWRL